MKDQRIFVYQRNEDSKLVLIEEFPNPREFALKYSENRVVAHFDCNDSARIRVNSWDRLLWETYGHVRRHPWSSFSVYAKVAYNAKGKLLPVSQLVGYARKAPRNKKWWWNRTRNPAYGHFRAIRTIQEKRWASAWSDEEEPVQPRAARNIHNIPDAWDDYMSDAQKSWKWQSKRRHQWKGGRPSRRHMAKKLKRNKELAQVA